MEERQAQVERIQAIGQELQQLARYIATQPTYADFEARLRVLHASNVFPEERLIAAVAQAARHGL